MDQFFCLLGSVSTSNVASIVKEYHTKAKKEWLKKAHKAIMVGVNWYWFNRYGVYRCTCWWTDFHHEREERLRGRTEALKTDFRMELAYFSVFDGGRHLSTTIVYGMVDYEFETHNYVPRGSYVVKYETDGDGPAISSCCEAPRSVQKALIGSNEKQNMYRTCIYV